MSQTIVKNETLREIKGELDKKDSLLVVRDVQVKNLKEGISIRDEIIQKQDEQIKLKSANEDICKVFYTASLEENKNLEKLNKKLNFRVKLFKGTTIAIPILGAITFGVLKLRR